MDLFVTNNNVVRQRSSSVSSDGKVKGCQIDFPDVAIGNEQVGQQDKGNSGLFSGIANDLSRRLPHYWSDFSDGVRDSRAVQKTLSTSVFLYFACLLPTIAFATLNSHTTHGKMDVRKGIAAQAIGQLTFGVIGGQHLSILLTTAPLSLFVKIIFSLSDSYDVPFEAFYCCVGVWTSFFLILSAAINASKIMKFCTRSTEEIFALFISVAFMMYAVLDVMQEFQLNYNSPSCAHPTTKNRNSCRRDSSLLYLILMLATYSLGMKLHNMNRSKIFGKIIGNMMSDYSLPIAVVTMSFVGSLLFRSVPVQKFVYDGTKPLFQIAPIHELGWKAVMISAVLGFCLAVLIFMDQNIGSAIVNNPENKLRKGSSYNWDLVVVALINLFSSLFTMPWLHVALPHAPMHVKCLAEFEEESIENGKSPKICRVRETRLTSIISHIFMAFSLFLLPIPLQYILPSVFDGLYLYMAITALAGNTLFERTINLFSTKQFETEATQVPLKETRIFTVIQLIQLVALCILGFSHQPFVKLAFPLVLLLLLFIRHTIVPKIIEERYLKILD